MPGCSAECRVPVRSTCCRQQSLHARPELCGRERLAEALTARADQAPRGDILIVVAGDEQHAQAGTRRHELVGQLASVHARHHDVGDQQVDGQGLPCGAGQRLGRAGRRDHGPARRAQHSPTKSRTPSSSSASSTSRHGMSWGGRRLGLGRGLLASGAAGRNTRNVAPRPGVECTCTSPPLCLAMP